MLAEFITLLLSPLALLLPGKRATPDGIKRFYRSAAWKRARYEALSRSPRCAVCGRSAKDGARQRLAESLSWRAAARRKTMSRVFDC